METFRICQIRQSVKRPVQDTVSVYQNYFFTHNNTHAFLICGLPSSETADFCPSQDKKYKQCPHGYGRKNFKGNTHVAEYLMHS